MQDAYAHCEAVVRAADKDRFLAALFAPADLRRHLHALYAFDGEIARVRDVAREVFPGEIRLQWWRDALAGQARGEVNANPVAAALLDTIAQCGLPREPLLGLIDAHSFDLYDEPMASLADLDSYGRDTEAAVMMLGTRVLAGGEDPGMAAAAAAAGIACTIAYRLRSFPFDVSRRQMFVPLELLQRHGVSREEVEARQDSPGLQAALAELRGHARAALAQFRGGAADIPERRAPAFLVVAVVPAWLARLDRAAGDSFTPVEVPRWARQWAIWRAARRWPVV
jgi:15-cis-phytoene synthase